MLVRTRFAPSPTGFLHVGGARTALFNWLFARQQGGQFILRIEDTDQVRSTEQSAAGILQDLRWLGLDWDAGPVVGQGKNEYFQSMRLELYRQHLRELIRQGQAYEAYETPEQLAALRAEAEKQKRPFRYRRQMAGRAAPGAAQPVLRFEMPWQDLHFKDLILGDIRVAGDEHDDIVIRKSDGFPTYHFAVVVDDHAMGITHVLRAQEHLMNTPKHLALYAAFGWSAPPHGHLPLVFNLDGSKMSKRDRTKAARAALQAYARQEPDALFEKLARRAAISSDTIRAFMARQNDDAALASKLAACIGCELPEIDVQDFRRSGYLAEALVNFLVLLGWSPGGNREILSRREMIEAFSLEQIGRTSGRFNRKKLHWMNGEYIRASSIEQLSAAVDRFNEVTDYPLQHADADTRHQLLAMYQPRMATLAEMARNSVFFFQEPVYDPAALAQHVLREPGPAVLREIETRLKAMPRWDRENLAPVLEHILALGQKRGAAAQTLRVVVSGGPVSPPLLETLLLLGRDKTLARIARHLAAIGREPPVPAHGSDIS